MYLQIQKIFRGGGVGCQVGVMNNCVFWGLGMGQMFFLMNFLSLIFLGSLDFILFRFVYVYIVCIYIYIYFYYFVGVVVLFCYLNQLMVFVFCMVINEKRVENLFYVYICLKIKFKDEFKNEGRFGVFQVCCVGSFVKNNSEFDNFC